MSQAVINPTLGRKRMANGNPRNARQRRTVTRQETASRVLREKLVSARRNQDLERQVLLSGILAFLKHNLRRTCGHPGCGAAVAAWALNCATHQARMLVAVAAVAFLALPLAAAELDLPKALRAARPARMESPRGAELFGRNHRMRRTALVAPRQPALAWQHPNVGEVLFYVESSPHPDGPWTQIGVTDQTSFPIQTSQPREFFRVGARWK